MNISTEKIRPTETSRVSATVDDSNKQSFTYNMQPNSMVPTGSTVYAKQPPETGVPPNIDSIRHRRLSRKKRKSVAIKLPDGTIHPERLIANSFMKSVDNHRTTAVQFQFSVIVPHNSHNSHNSRKLLLIHMKN